MKAEDTAAYYENSSLARKIAVIIVCIGSFMNPLMLSPMIVAIPSIAADFQASAVLISWLPTAFLLTNVILLLPFGRFADRYGRKLTYQVGVAVMIFASCCAAASPNIYCLLVARVLQGVGASMIFGTGLAIVTAVVPKAQRGAAIGFITSSLYMGLTAGPFFGGLVTEHLGWRFVFLMPIPLAVFVILIGAIWLKGEWKNPQKRRFDFTGALIFATFSVALVVGLSRLPSWEAVISLLIGGVLLRLFVYHQTRIETPLVKVDALAQNRTFSFSLLTAFFMYAANFTNTFLVSLYLQYIGALSPGEAGAVLVFQAIMMASTAPVAGRIADHIQVRYVATFGCVLTAAGYIWLCGIGYDTPRWVIMVGQVLVGVGFGFFSTPNSSAAMGSVRAEVLGIASSMINLVRNYGNLVGMGIVMMLVSIFLGGTELDPSQYDALLRTIKLSLTLSAVYALTAACFSALRGQVN